MSVTKEYKHREHIDFYSFFAKYSLMEDYGFTQGLINRLLRKILPLVPDKNSIEYILLNRKDPVSYILSLPELKTITDTAVVRQLDLSIKALCAKVIAFGLDSDIKAKYNYLELDSEPFEKLLDTLGNLDECKNEVTIGLRSSLEEVESLIINFRKNKNKIGTNLHLTLTTRRILEYTQRVKELLDLKLNIDSAEEWEKILTEYIEYSRYKGSIKRYIKRHSDLVALEIVEHTSDKGKKYIAENRKEYMQFFYRSMLGGGIIALFAFLKVVIESWQLTQLGDALFFSLNYALCFIIVEHLGGIIATKQPAMTASTIAKNIDNQGGLNSISCITDLVRKVARSQFISVMGNFIMALSLASLIIFLMKLAGLDTLTRFINPEYQIKNVLPTWQLLFFAATAGFFLAFSGLISGYFENKVKASKIPHRIYHTRLFRNNKRFAAFVEKKTGTLMGNIALGFFLGSAFLLSTTGFIQVDIRHIAFSSAYVGYSVTGAGFALNTILLALLGTMLIGFTNFIVSFSITLYLALRSRGSSFRIIPLLLLNILKDFLRRPLYYFFRIDKQTANSQQQNFNKSCKLKKDEERNN